MRRSHVLLNPSSHRGNFRKLTWTRCNQHECRNHHAMFGQPKLAQSAIVSRKFHTFYLLRSDDKQRSDYNKQKNDDDAKTGSTNEEFLRKVKSFVESLDKNGERKATPSSD